MFKHDIMFYDLGKDNIVASIIVKKMQNKDKLQSFTKYLRLTLVFRYGVKVGPRPWGPGPLDPGSASKFNSGPTH